MRTPWKWLVGLLVALPIAAYAAGSLSSSSADEPERREPVILRESPSPPGPGRSDATPPRPGDDDGDDDTTGGEDAGGDDRGGQDDNEVEVVTPKPTRVGGDDGGDDRGEYDGGGDDDTDSGGDT